MDEFTSWFLDFGDDEQVAAGRVGSTHAGPPFCSWAGDKTGNSRWYDENVPIADDRYDDYLREMEKEGSQ